jgi:hypothetical protein
MADFMELKNMIIINMRELMHLKKLLREKNGELQQSRDAQKEKEQTMQKMSLKLQKAVRAYEKKLSSRPESQETCIQTDADDSRIALEKDLFYYRQTNKDLKLKLRELMAKAHNQLTIPAAAHV